MDGYRIIILPPPPLINALVCSYKVIKMRTVFARGIIVKEHVYSSGPSDGSNLSHGGT